MNMNRIAKHGAKLVTALATTKTPKITLIFGGSYGAGNFGMCGRGLKPRFLITWPTSSLCVMGGAQASNVITQLRKDNALKFKREWSTQIEQETKQQMLEEYKIQSRCYYGSARLWDDGTILPEDTRKVLGFSVMTCLRTPIDDTKFGIFRM